MKRWGKRFLASTRGQVVELLRRGEATVNELAEALDLTDNAIRAHLNTLERDGLVHQAGKRPGVRKPERLYALTPEAERLFPKAYHVLLNQLLTVLAGRLGPDEVQAILREVGRRLSDEPSSHAEDVDLRERAQKAVGVLQELGGLAELQDSGEGLLIRGYSCPLASAVREHPEICQLAEALLTEIIGEPVEELCIRDESPRCRFLVAESGIQAS